LLLLFLLFMFVELSTDVFVLFVCLFVCLFVLFHSVDHHVLLGQAMYGVAMKIPPINRFSKVLVLLLEKKAQKNHLTLEMEWEFHQFDAQTCDPNT